MNTLSRTFLIAIVALFALLAFSCAKNESPEEAKTEEAPAAGDATPGQPEATASLAPNGQAPATGAQSSASNRSGSKPASTTTRPAASSSSGASGWGDQPATKPAASTEPAAPIMKTYTLPSGSTLRVRTTSTLSTKTAQNGQTFAASLVEPLVVEGRVIAEKGANVTGKIVSSDPGGRVKGKASLEVAVTSVELVNGKTSTVETSSYGQVADSSTKKDATKVAIGTGIGAAIGAIAGGGKGAAIGAGVGAGAGTGTVLATRGNDAVIPAEALINFTTSSPISVTLPQ